MKKRTQQKIRLAALGAGVVLVVSPGWLVLGLAQPRSGGCPEHHGDGPRDHTWYSRNAERRRQAPPALLHAGAGDCPAQSNGIAAPPVARTTGENAIASDRAEPVGPGNRPSPHAAANPTPN